MVDSMSDPDDDVDIPEKQPHEHCSDANDEGPTSDEQIEHHTNQKTAWKNLFIQKHQQYTQKRARSPDHHLESRTSLSRTTSHQLAKKARSEGDLGGPVGLSRSARSEKAAREAADRGDWDPEERRKWKKAILQIDAKAEFYEDKPRAVRCSNCGSQRMVKTKNDTRRFLDHYDECVQKKWQNKKGNAHVSRTSTLTSSTYKHLFSHPSQVHTPTSVSSTKPKHPPPCPGLSVAQDERIPIYLKRTSVSGGGARSISIIAVELFSKPFRKLSSQNKDIVLDTQRHELAWTNHHQKLRVFSSCCTNVAHQSDRDQVKPCHSCCALLKSTRFRSAINKPTPSDNNFKYINHRFRNQVLGEQFARVKGLKNLLDSAVGPIFQRRNMATN